MNKKDLIELILKQPNTLVRENYFSKQFIIILKNKIDH